MDVHDWKFKARLGVLRRIARHAAQDTSSKFAQEIDFANAIDFVDGPAFVRFNQRYWSEVARFKSENGFGPGDRINAPKVAAITIFCFLTNKEPLFVSKVPELDHTYIEYCHFYCCIYAMFYFLKLEHEHIGDRGAVYACFREILREPSAAESRAALYSLCMYMGTFPLIIQDSQSKIAVVRESD